MPDLERKQFFFGQSGPSAEHFGNKWLYSIEVNCVLCTNLIFLTWTQAGEFVARMFSFNALCVVLCFINDTSCVSDTVLLYLHCILHQELLME